MGFFDYFDPIVLSSEYGRRKPDPSIFYYAARMARVPTGSCVYVGDKVNRDILGAKRAGFKLAIQIIHSYDTGEPDLGATPDAIIHSMTELIPIIGRVYSNGEREKPKKKPHLPIKLCSLTPETFCIIVQIQGKTYGNF